MRRALLIAATALGFATGGCETLFGGGETTESPVVVSPAAPAESPAPTTTFPQPTVTPANPSRGILPPDLISSTDPNQRVQQVKGARNDPFALLPTTPTVQLPEGATPPAPTTTTVPATPPAARGTAPTRRTSQSPNQTTGSGTAGRSPARPGTASAGAQPPRSPIKVNPPRPQPELARAVQVTGVVQVGDQVFAIVNAPNEPTSRYVQEGQRLAGGQVLVRRIETNRAEPVVILEQFGVEVVRAVGEGGVPTPAPGAPAAVAPVPGTPAT